MPGIMLGGANLMFGPKPPPNPVVGALSNLAANFGGGGQSGGQAQSGGLNYSDPRLQDPKFLARNPQLRQQIAQNAPQGGGGTGGSGGSGGTGSIPAVPVMTNTAAPDPNVQQLWNQYQANLSAPNQKYEDLWKQYQGQLSTSNLDRLQDVNASKIRDQYSGLSKEMGAGLAARGMLGSGVEQQMKGNLSGQELRALGQSDAQLSLADQQRRDQLIMGGLPMATYGQQRLDQLLAQGLPLAEAQHQLANQDKALGLEQWRGMLDAQLSREQMDLQRNIAQQNAAQAAQAQQISLLTSLMPLF